MSLSGWLSYKETIELHSFENGFIRNVEVPKSIFDPFNEGRNKIRTLGFKHEDYEKFNTVFQNGADALIDYIRDNYNIEIIKHSHSHSDFEDTLFKFFVEVEVSND